MFSIDIVFPRSVDQNINTNMCRGGYPPNADEKGENLWESRVAGKSPL